MNLKFISYDGKWPNLCSGKLILDLDGIKIHFPDYCLSSGGKAYFTNDYADSHIEEGEWTISGFPEEFPVELQVLATKLVNDNIPHGCCGGCL